MLLFRYFNAVEQLLSPRAGLLHIVSGASSSDAKIPFFPEHDEDELRTDLIAAPQLQLVPSYPRPTIYDFRTEASVLEAAQLPAVQAAMDALPPQPGALIQVGVPVYPHLALWGGFSPSDWGSVHYHENETTSYALDGSVTIDDGGYVSEIFTIRPYSGSINVTGPSDWMLDGAFMDTYYCMGFDMWLP